MNALTLISFCVVVAVAQAGLIAGPSAIWGAPALVRSGPAVIAAQTIVAPRTLISAHGLNGITVDALGQVREGQWIPDINEQLYDDGSYKVRIL